MATLPRIDYGARDFAGLMRFLQDYAQARYPQWTDFAEASLGNVLLEMLAAIGDILSFYLDQQANEAFLATVTQRKNLIRILKRMQYKLRSARPAEAILRFTLDQPAVAPVTIPARTVVMTQGPAPLPFETQADLVIPAGGLSGEVRARQVVTRREAFVGDGSPYQRIVLAYTPYVDGSLIVRGNGEPWQAVETLITSGPSDRHYLIDVDENDRATIRFGDGVNGAKPSGPIDVAYETGGGTAGNVEAGTITGLVGSFVDAGGNLVSLTVTNPLPATGGVDRESLEEARQAAPLVVRSNDRTVSASDYRANAEAVAGVARALPVTFRQDPSLPRDVVRLRIVPDGGGAPSQALKDAVMAELTERKPIPIDTTLEVADPLYRTVDVSVQIAVRGGHDPATVLAAVEQAIRDHFSYRRLEEDGSYAIDFGKAVYVADLVAALMAVPGVRNVVVVSPAADIVPTFEEIPALGAVTVAVV